MNIKQVDSKYAAEFLEIHHNSKLIDVRTENEWQNVGIPLKNSKQLILLSWRTLPNMEINLEFEENFYKAVLDKTAILFFICRSGGRSQEAAKFIANLGYITCYNVLDGFEGVDSSTGWKNSNLPWQVS